jgi:hypothetical protein
MKKTGNISNSVIWVVVIIGSIILAIVMCCWLLFGLLQNYDDVHAPERLYSEHGSYRFNTESILKDILEGKDILYEKVDHELGLEPPEDNMQVVDLSEDELFHVARSFFEYHWQDGMDDWALHQITYRALDCEEGMSGMVFAIYDFEKYYKNEGKLIMRSISIQSWDGTIDWREYAEIKYGSHHEIDIDKYKYSATQQYLRQLA